MTDKNNEPQHLTYEQRAWLREKRTYDLMHGNLEPSVNCLDCEWSGSADSLAKRIYSHDEDYDLVCPNCENE